MVVPDSAMIAEIILFAEGFNNTKVTYLCYLKVLVIVMMIMIIMKFQAITTHGKSKNSTSGDSTHFEKGSVNQGNRTNTPLVP